MGSELVPDNPGWVEIAKHKPTTDNPLLLIPSDWRNPVAVLWMCNAHLLPSSLALCSTLRVYSEHGITSEQIATIVRRLLDPERRQRHKFASDLIADLSGLVAESIKSSKVREEANARRQDADEWRYQMPQDLFKPE